MKRIETSQAGFFALINLLRCKELFCNEEAAGTDDNAQLYLKGRNELCEKGYIELSFDGTVSQSREFERFAYSIKNTQACVGFALGGDCLYYLLAPTEFVRIEKKEAAYILERCTRPQLPEFIKESVFSASSGSVVTTRGEEKKELRIEDTDPCSEDRARALAEHMCLFFGKENK